MLGEMRDQHWGGGVLALPWVRWSHGTGGALANVFIPLRRQTRGFTQPSIFSSQREASCCPASAMVVTKWCPGCPRVLSLGGEGLGVILPWQGHTAEHTLALPVLLPQKLN